MAQGNASVETGVSQAGRDARGTVRTYPSTHGATVSGRVACGLSPTAGASWMYSARRHGQSRRGRLLIGCCGNREPAWLNNATTYGEVAGVHSERCPVHRVCPGPGRGGRNALPILGPPRSPLVPVRDGTLRGDGTASNACPGAREVELALVDPLLSVSHVGGRVRPVVPPAGGTQPKGVVELIRFSVCFVRDSGPCPPAIYRITMVCFQ